MSPTLRFVVLIALLWVVTARRDWQSCILNIESYFLTPTYKTYQWSDEGQSRCGFGPIEIDASQPGADNGFLKLMAGKSATFIGDSTALRMFTYTVNQLAMDPSEKLTYSKVAEAPKSRVKVMRLPNATGTFTVRFFRMQFVSTSRQVLTDALTTSPRGGGLVFVTAGNWDLNWKIQKKKPMPGLAGPVQNWTVAQAYWTKYVDEMFTTLATVLPQLPANSRPTVVFREQFLPNCRSQRFRDRKWRQCGSLIRPVVIPFYRRTLARLSWALNVPVVAGFLPDRPRQCAMSDGVHLNFECMAFEQQLLWNVGRLMLQQRPKVVQGEPALRGAALPVAEDYGLNVTNYLQWFNGFASKHGVSADARERMAATLEPIDEGPPGPNGTGDETDAPAEESPPPPPPHAAATLRSLHVPMSELIPHILVAIAVLFVLAVPLWWTFR
jgi:hypothetical protein